MAYVRIPVCIPIDMRVVIDPSRWDSSPKGVISVSTRANRCAARVQTVRVYEVTRKPIIHTEAKGIPDLLLLNVRVSPR